MFQSAATARSLRRSCGLVVVLVVALVAATTVRAAELTPKRLDVRRLTLGTGAVRDRTVSIARRLQRSTSDKWWGGTYYTRYGEPVRVNVSDLYPVDPTYAQSVVDLLGELLHGSELARVTVWIAPFDLVQSICGPNAVGCYDPRSGYLQVTGNDVGGLTVEQVLIHEYGHHLATNRVNAPWQAALWGTKRWASYENVCTRTEQGLAFPGDEGDHYLQNPGEAFAESYMFLNAQRLSLLLPPWDYDPMFFPDFAALSKISQDVTSPWTADTRYQWSGRFGTRGASRVSTVSTPLDGPVTFRLTAPRGTVLRIYSSGRLLAASTRVITGTICGQRTLKTRVLGGGKGRFRVLADVP